MQSIKSDVIGGFGAFLDVQRAGDGECAATLAQFDHDYEVVYQGIPLREVPPLDLQPRGRTALLDSMGKLITDTATQINALAEDDKPGTVVVAIMTDGLENASQEWSQPAIKALVEQQTSAGWEFLYMGADQDAVEVGKGLGVKAEQSITYARGKSREAMIAASGNVRRYRTAKLDADDAQMPAFSDEQRLDLSEK
jgi:hypothetical protein